MVRNPRGLHELDFLDDGLSSPVGTAVSYKAEIRTSSLACSISAIKDVGHENDIVLWRDSTEVVGSVVSQNSVEEKLKMPQGL